MKRKLQRQKNSLVVNVPSGICDVFELKPGDSLEFKVQHEKIIVTVERIKEEVKS